MEVRRYHGNILSSTAEVIAHQANCLGKMDAGIDQEIRDKCPEAFPPYAAACRKGNMLDQCQMVKTKSGLYIANLFGQYGAKTRLHGSQGRTQIVARADAGDAPPHCRLPILHGSRPESRGVDLYLFPHPRYLCPNGRCH